ncbi:MAG TPA: NAD-dependent epimerase/dehydratase family protein [Acidimicrobiales bacterium]
MVVTGAAGAIGRRVVGLLAEADDVASVLALDRRSVQGSHPKVDHRVVDLKRPDQMAEMPELAAADTVVHLSFAASSIRRRPGALETEVTRQLLAAASAAGVRHLVVLSSATVYGAWPNNPVPITEGAALRPIPDFAYAVGHAEVEQLVVDWAADQPGRTVAVLRPVTGLAEDGSSWLARALAGGAGVLAPEEDPPAQFVHLDDVAQAIDLARRRRLDGPFNVSPDGWIAGPRIRALAGSQPRLRPPAWFTHWISNLRWRFQRGPIPPGLLPYMTNAWLVANDRLKAEGWQPQITNEQAYVAGTETRWWQLLTPKRRQELALGVAGLLAAGGLVAAGLVIRRAIKRRRAT